MNYNIETEEELKKYINKPILCENYCGKFQWVTILRELYKPKDYPKRCKFPVNYYVVGNYTAVMNKSEKAKILYNQPIEKLCTTSAQVIIRKLTQEEMKKYKICVHEAMFKKEYETYYTFKGTYNIYDGSEKIF